jgi:hypothetical protein
LSFLGADVTADNRISVIRLLRGLIATGPVTHSGTHKRHLMSALSA